MNAPEYAGKEKCHTKKMAILYWFHQFLVTAHKYSSS